jgi:branched-chain amino acid transport system substrate-binding protein
MGKRQSRLQRSKKSGGEEMKKRDLRKFWVAACLVLGVFFLFSGTPEPKAAEMGEINVVLDVPLIGKIAYYGRDHRAAFQLALEKVNEKGILVGGKKYRLNGVIQDNEGHKIDKVLKETAKNVTRHHPIALISTASAEAIPLKEVCMDYKFILMAASQVPAFAEPPVPLGVRHFIRCSDQGETIQKIFETLKPEQRKLFTLVEMNETCVEGARVAREMWKAAGGQVTGLVEFPSETLDYVPIVTKAMSSNPEVIFNTGSSIRGAKAADTARKQGYKGIFYFFGMFSPIVAQRYAAPAFLEGSFYTATRYDKETPIIKDFMKVVQAKAGSDLPPEMTSGITYDMVHFLAAAIQKANSLDVFKVRAAMNDIDADTLPLGLFMGKMNKKGELEMNIIPARIHDGKPVFLK